MTTDATVEVEHGIAEAIYSNLPGPQQTCVMECLCGFTSHGRSWEEAGWGLDEHLKEPA